MTDSFQRRLSTASRQPKCATFCGLARLAAVCVVSLKPLLAGSAQPPTVEPLAAAVPPAFASVPGLPLCFEFNAGQEGGGPVRFVARNRDGVFCVSPTETVITLRKAGSPTVPGFCPRTRQEPGLEARTVSIQFLGANASARMTGTGELRGKVNYLIGNDPAKWQRSVKTFARVEVQEAYPGIKVIHYGNQRQLEYDFNVAPGADPEMIAFRVTGADQLEIDPQGDLLIKLGADYIRQKKPIIYQVDHGRREEIPGGYRLRDNQVVAFQVGSYDRELPLVIDPVLSYSTFLGGLDNDTGRAIVLDNSGNVYLAGDTLSSQLGTTDAFQSVYAGGYPAGGGDAFVAKFDPSGTNLLYLTYLGGSGDDAATSIALDPDGNVYLTGVTDSTNFPVSTNAFLGNRLGGKGEMYFGLHPYDAFVAKLSPDGSQLIYASYLGGSGRDEGLGIVVDTNFCAYVTGFTESTNFPATSNAFQTKLQGGADAFVTKIASNGMSFVYSTFLGGTNTDKGQSIAVDALGRAFVTGFTMSTNFPVSTNAFQTNGPMLGLPSQVFVSVLETNGASIAQSTYLGGLGNAMGFHIALDGAGHAFVTGSEAGPGFPVTPGHINPGGVFKSQDGASNWVPSNLGLLHNQVQGIGIDPVNTSNLYVGTGRGIARSTDGGATWQVSLDTFDQFVTFAIDPLQPSMIYAGATEVLKSTNSGVSWFSSSTGLTTSVTAPTNVFVTINKLVLDPLSPATLYAGTESGVFKTTNAAANWRNASEGLANRSVRDLVLDPLDSATLFAATTAGVFRSTNGGGRWIPFNEGLTNLVAHALTFDSATPPAIYAGLGDSTVFRRAQAATNWILISTSLVSSNNVFSNSFTPNSITLLAGDPAAPATLYAGTRKGLFKSLDSGTNWVLATNGLPGLPIAALALDPVSTSTLYLGTFNSFAGVDAFLTKFSPDLTSLVYSVTLGGSGVDQAVGVALDSGGNAFVVGSTTSLDFPTVQPVDYPSSFNSGFSDAFVTAVNSDGSDLLFSSYLGGTGNDFGVGIALDSATNVWLAGQTFSPDFPVAAGFQCCLRGPSDAFLAKLSMTYSVVNVTLETVPPGIDLFVDGTTNATPITFQWPAGSFHTLGALTQSAGTNAQYTWTSWSDGGDLFHSAAAFADTNITANFRLQYFLAMSSTNTTVTDTNLAINATNSGAISPPSGWYDAGTNLSISATPPADDSFGGWLGSGNGSFSGTNNPAVITLNGPIEQTATFSGPLTNRLKVVINGKGSVAPNYDGKFLKIGTVYSMTAKPGTGASFSNWTGVFPVETPKLSFVMTNGLVLEANFVPSPFGPVAGTYAGLFFNTNLVALQSSGFFSATISGVGSLSARFQMGGRTYRVSGVFPASGLLPLVVLRPGLTSLAVTLQLDLSGTSNLLTGRINGGAWTADLLANRAVYSKTNSPPQAGKKYTLVIPGAPDSLAEPGGDGSGTVAIDGAGNISFSGRLGDGATLAQKTFISGQGQWPFYASLYGGNGFILGWLDFNDKPDSDLSGLLYWSKLPRPFRSPYPSGFTLQSDAAGSLYSFTNGVPVLALNQGQGELVLENGKLTQSITNSFSLSAGNKVTSTNRMTLSIATKSGLFSGKAFDPGTGKPVSFSGAVLQKQNRGAGSFRQTDQTGRVLLGP